MSTGYFLLDNPNPNAYTRVVDGITYQAWFRHPDFRLPIDLLFVHVTASTPASSVETDNVAENVASWQSRNTYVGSYQAMFSSRSKVETLPDRFIAYAVGGRRYDGTRFNNLSVSGSFAGDRRVWEDDYRWWADRALDTAAHWYAERVIRYNLPIVRRYRNEILEGKRGISDHAAVDPVNRAQDPGTNFPWDEFIGRIEDIVNRPPPREPMDIHPRVSKASQQFDFVPNGSVLMIRPTPHGNNECWVRIWVDGAEVPDPLGRGAHHVLDDGLVLPVRTQRVAGAEVGVLVSSYPDNDAVCVCRS